MARTRPIMIGTSSPVWLATEKLRGSKAATGGNDDTRSRLGAGIVRIAAVWRFKQRHAQIYPSGSIRWLVGFAAGGPPT